MACLGHRFRPDPAAILIARVVRHAEPGRGFGKQKSVEDMWTWLKAPRSTVLSEAGDPVIVVFRRQTLLPPEECQLVLQPRSWILRRSALCLWIDELGRIDRHVREHVSIGTNIGGVAREFPRGGGQPRDHLKRRGGENTRDDPVLQGSVSGDGAGRWRANCVSVKSRHCDAGRE